MQNAELMIKELGRFQVLFYIQSYFKNDFRYDEGDSPIFLAKKREKVKTSLKPTDTAISVMECSLSFKSLQAVSILRLLRYFFGDIPSFSINRL